MSRHRRTYLDFGASQPLLPRVLRAYTRVLALYGNPSAPHEEGRRSREALEDARVRIARTLAVKPEELVCTGSGTEANALAILGTKRGHCVTTAIEHSSSKKSFRIKEEHGSRVTYVKPDALGLVSVESVLAALRPQTVLVSLHHTESESGVVQRVRDIALAVKKVNPHTIVHVDASQSPLWFDAGPHALGADLVTYDAQKVGGPKGVGILYRDFSVPLTPIMGGGTQERSLRPGTENVPAIVAAAAAFEEAAKGRRVRAERVRRLRDELWRRVQAAVPEARVLGSLKRRAPNNLFLAIPGVDGDYLAVLMDAEGVAVTPRSACLGSGGAVSETAFLLTNDESLAASTIRFTLGPTTRMQDIVHAARALEKVLPLAQRP